MILSTDAEKAFDRIDCDFLNAVLVRLGLGPSYVTLDLSVLCITYCSGKGERWSFLVFPIQNGNGTGMSTFTPPIRIGLGSIVVERLI